VKESHATNLLPPARREKRAEKRPGAGESMS